jgi:F-type H+-transporting ATPase subunit epsilon
MVDTAHTHAEGQSAAGVRCVVVTPERALLDESAEFVVVTMYDGELGVLPGRLALIGRLGYGELRIQQGGRTKRYFVDGGLAQVRRDVVTVLTPRAVEAERIDVQAAERALSDALSTMPPTPEAAEANYRTQERARAQLRVAGAGGPAASHHA